MTDEKIVDLFMSRAINLALDRALGGDETVFLLGEDIGTKGGAFGVTRGLKDKYGPMRVVDTPISENSIVGMGIGASMTGLRPVVEIMYMDFIALATDQILNKAVKLDYITHGAHRVPLVIRTAAGGGRFYGPDHSQALESIFLSVPGLVIAVPSNPNDAYHMLLDSIERDGPVLFIEYKKLYESRGPVDPGARVDIFGRASPASPGSDATLVTYGRMLKYALDVKGRLLDEAGIDIEVIDLRYLNPMDEGTIASSLSKTGRLITLEESPLTGGVGGEIVARMVSSNFFDLDAPPLRIAARDTPIPFSPFLEETVLPSKERIFEEIMAHISEGR